MVNVSYSSSFMNIAVNTNKTSTPTFYTRSQPARVDTNAVFGAAAGVIVAGDETIIVSNFETYLNSLTIKFREHSGGANGVWDITVTGSPNAMTSATVAGYTGSLGLDPLSLTATYGNAANRDDFWNAPATSKAFEDAVLLYHQTQATNGLLARAKAIAGNTTVALNSTGDVTKPSNAFIRLLLINLLKPNSGTAKVTLKNLGVTGVSGAEYDLSTNGDGLLAMGRPGYSGPHTFVNLGTELKKKIGNISFCGSITGGYNTGLNSTTINNNIFSDSSRSFSSKIAMFQYAL